MLKDGLEITLRELLLDRGLLDDNRWEDLTQEDPPGLAETRGGERPSPAAPEPEAERLGDYRILSELGRGAMGVVYEAIQEKLNRRVALKVLPETQALQGVARERFLREAKATASLKHPGIVPIYDIGEERGVHFFVMELLEGRTLKQVLREEGPLDPRRAAEVGRQAAEALGFAHQQGVIHRDVKPDNIVLQGDGTVVLTDFGLARHKSDQTVTRAGVIVGTPLYMAPEQARGEEVDLRADLYGLGITLFELLAGQPPFSDAADTAILLERVAHQQPPPLHTVAPAIPRDLAAIVEVSVEKEPENRFLTADAMAADLGRFLAGEPILARPPGQLLRAWRSIRRHRRPVALAFAVGIVVVFLGVALRQLGLRWRADTLVLESISLSEAGQREDARAKLAEALELWPGLAEALFRQGELALAEGDAGQALRSYEAALNSDPEHVEALLGRGALLRKSGRAKEAMTCFQRARKLANEADPRPALHGGLTLSDLQQADGAREWLRAGLETARLARATRDPSYREAVHRLGELELQAGSYGAAQAELEEAVRLDPSRVASKVLLARALFRSGNTQAAVEVASAALRRAPNNLQARELRGLAYRSLGLFPQAFLDFSAAKELPSARLMRGVLRFEALDFTSSGSSPRTGPQVAQGFDYEGALEDLQASVEHAQPSRDQRVLGRVVLGWILLLQQDAGGRVKRRPTLRQIDAALEVAPRAALARLARGFLWLAWGKLAHAGKDFQLALGLSGAEYAARVGLARVAAKGGDVDGALRHLDLAVALAPQRPTAYGYRYRLRLASGRPGAAKDRQRAATNTRKPPRPSILSPGTDPLALAEQCSDSGFHEFAQALRQPAANTRYLARAGAWLRRALQFDPWSLSASARRASVLYLQARVPEAEAGYARARAVDPALVEAELMRGVVQRDLLKGAGPKVAEATFRQALKEAPPRPALQGGLRFELAKALVLQARWEEALPLLKEALSFTPRRYCVAALQARLLTQLNRPGKDRATALASTLFYEGRRDRIRGTLYGYAGTRLRSLEMNSMAEHFLTRAIEADPRNAQAWRQRSRVRFQKSIEEVPAGFVDAFVAAELDPTFTRRFLELESRLGRFGPLLGDIRSRVQVVAREAPELPAATFLGAYLDFYNRRFKAAVRGFSKAVRISGSRSYMSLAYRGAARLRAGDTDGAFQDLTAANKLFPKAPVTAFWMACLQAKRGQLSDALSTLEAQARRGYLFPQQIRRAPELVDLRDHPRLLKLLEDARRR